MNGRDAIEIAAHNLLKLKLRSVLTTAGVVIAIAAFVAMLSFGAGNQRLVSEQYEKFGLLFTIQVFPRDAKPDSAAPPVLDQASLETLSRLPGVRRAYPFDPIAVEVTSEDTTLPSRAQALPASALAARRFSQWAAGSAFDSDSAREVLVSTEVMNELGWKPTVTFEEGIVQTIDWYLSNTDWLNHVVSGQYQQFARQAPV